MILRFRIAWILVAAAILLSGCGNKSSIKSSSVAQSKQPNAKQGAPATPSQPSGSPGTGSSRNQSGAGGLFGSEPGNTAANPFSLSPTPGPTAASGKPGTMPITPLPPNAKPQAKQLFMLLQNAYRSARSLKVQGTSSMTIKRDGKSAGQQSNEAFSTTYKAPGKFIIVSPGVSMTCDGKNVSIYSSVAKRYMSTPFNKDFARNLVYSKPGVGLMGLLFGMDYTGGIESYKLLPDVKVAGQDAFALALRFKKGAGGAPDTVLTQTLWIGKRDLCIYRNEVVAVTKPSRPKGYTGKMPKVMEARIVGTVSQFAVNPMISDAAFVFKAPSGAQAIEKPKSVNLIGKPAPDFSFAWTDGANKKLSDFRGKPVVLVFWAMPMPDDGMRALKSACDNHKDDATVIAINFNVGQEDKVREFLKSKNCVFPFVSGNAEIGNVAAKDYGLRGLPSVLLIDGSGKVRQATIGVPEAKDLNAKLKEYASNP